MKVQGITEKNVQQSKYCSDELSFFILGLHDLISCVLAKLFLRPRSRKMKNLIKMVPQGCIYEPAASEIRHVLCTVSLGTFIALRVHHVGTPDLQHSTFQKTLAT